MSFLLVFIALIVELLLGYPQRVFDAIGHPVTWIGRSISWADRLLNREAWSHRGRRLGGIVTLLGLAIVAGGVAWLLQHLLGAGFGIMVTALIGSSLLAQRSLAEHVEAVAAALETGGVAAGREAVSKIVGRDPQTLDEAGVARAAIESLAENYSDGVVAPAFWMAVGGLPGAAIYKAVNTADSMIGHKTARHEAFGWAAARFDDLINLPASRLTAALLICASWSLPATSAGAAATAVMRDARHHRSPNAGWPEAAMAGALGLGLAGPRTYDGVTVNDAIMGAGGRRDAGASDIRRALALYRRSNLLLLSLAAALAAVATVI